MRVFALLPLFVLLAGCSDPPPPEAPPPSSSSAVTRWTLARAADNAPLLEVPARVLGSAEASGVVSPPFRGRIIRLHAGPGSTVARGQAIADVAMSEVSQAAGAYLSAVTRVEAWTGRVAQLKKLGSEGLVRASELNEAQVQLAEARASSMSALATLRAAGVEGSGASGLLERGGVVTLLSPVDGVLTELQAVLGESVEPTDKPIARIIGAGRTTVEAKVPHSFPKDVDFAFVDGAGNSFPLKPLGNSPAVDPNDGTALFWFAPEEGVLLAAGQGGSVRASLLKPEGAVLVAARAVAVVDAQTVVLVRDGDGFRQVPVKVLARSGAAALVRALDEETPLSVDVQVADDAALALAPEDQGDSH